MAPLAPMLGMEEPQFSMMCSTLAAIPPSR